MRITVKSLTYRELFFLGLCENKRKLLIKNTVKSRLFAVDTLKFGKTRR